MRNRYGEITRSPGLRAWSGRRQGFVLGLGQTLRGCSWCSSDPLAGAVPVLVWWLSPALPTVLNHIPSLLSQSQLSHPRPGTRPLGSSPDLAPSGWAALAGADFTAGFTREGWPRADSPPRKGPAQTRYGQRGRWEAVFGFWNPLPHHSPVPLPLHVPMGRPTAASLFSSAQWLFFIQGESQGPGSPLGPQAGSCLQSSVPHTGDPLRTLPPHNSIL